MRRAVLVGAVALAVGACLELSGPADGVASITELVPAAPAVEVGDVLRDTVGAVAPLRVVAFDGRGDTTKAKVVFSTLDTLLSVSQTGIVTGRTVSATAGRVVARVGDLQTEPASIRVVPRIVNVTRQALRAEWTYPPASTGKDSTLSPFGVTITGAGGVPVPSWLVRFRIVRSTLPRKNPDISPVSIVGDDGRPASIDSTNDSGIAARKLFVIPFAIDATSKGLDTVVVRVSTVRGASVDSADHTFILRPRS